EVKPIRKRRSKAKVQEVVEELQSAAIAATVEESVADGGLEDSPKKKRRRKKKKVVLTLQEELQLLDREMADLDAAWEKDVRTEDDPKIVDSDMSPLPYNGRLGFVGAFLHSSRPHY